MSPPPLVAPAPAPAALVTQRANAGEEVWHQLGLQFLWICVVQAAVIGVCGALNAPPRSSATAFRLG